MEADSLLDGQSRLCDHIREPIGMRECEQVTEGVHTVFEGNCH
jgi:hypothetical protein